MNYEKKTKLYVRIIAAVCAVLLFGSIFLSALGR